MLVNLVLDEIRSIYTWALTWQWNHFISGTIFFCSPCQCSYSNQFATVWLDYLLNLILTKYAKLNMVKTGPFLCLMLIMKIWSVGHDWHWNTIQNAALIPHNSCGGSEILSILDRSFMLLRDQCCWNLNGQCVIVVLWLLSCMEFCCFLVLLD